MAPAALALDWPPWPAPGPLASRLILMAVLFCVSLFAVSFPAVARSNPRLKVPGVLFFLGKHFGTGVILATAFVHLLQDAFEALMSDRVRERWGRGPGHWAGMMVLGSLLLIFVVEYISTSFVDRLHSYDSVPTTPTSSPTSSRAPSPATPKSPSVRSPHLPSPPREGAPPAIAVQTPGGSTRSAFTPRTPLLPARSSRYATFHTRSSTHPAAGDAFFGGGHHRHETSAEHTRHHSHQYWEAWRTWLGLAAAEGADAEQEDGERAAGPGRKPSAGEHAGHGHAHGHGHGHGHAHAHFDDGFLDGGEENGHGHVDVEVDVHDEEDPEKARIGRRRQVVGIIMLQAGIMIHSLTIGLTLAITSGAEFSTLVVAIIFHQLFEGLSLGIRIAALPDGSESPSSVLRHALKPTLTLTFALTTPVGIAIGLIAFAPGSAKGDDAQITLIRGLLSALSAGMLIYAACVEMLAGDFVMDPRLWRASVGRQAMALGALALGVAGMSIVAIFD